MRRALLLVVMASCNLDLPTPRYEPNFTKDAEYEDGYVPPIDGSMPDSQAMDVVANDVITVMDGGACDGGVCPAMPLYQTGMLDPRFIDTDGSFLYFVDGSTTIDILDPKAPQNVTAITSSEFFINDMHVVGGFVYFTNGSGGGVKSVVSRCGLAASCPSRTNYGATGHNPYGVTVSGNNLYFTYDDSLGNGGGVYACPLTGCGTGTSQHAQLNASLLVSDSTKLFWSADDASNTGVHRCDIGNCNNTFVVGAMNSITDVSLFGSDVYYTDSASINKFAKTGGNQAPIAAQQMGAHAVRVDGSHVYWFTNNALRRCPINTDCTQQTNKIQELASNLNQPFGLSITSAAIYFTTRGDHTVWRILK